MKKLWTTMLAVMLLLLAVLPVSALETQRPWRSAVMEMRKNRLDNQELGTENKRLRLSIREQLIELKESGQTLEDSVKLELKALTEQLKEKAALLKATQGDIRELTIGLKELIEKKETEEIVAIYNQVIEIQEYRNGVLKEINVLLNKIKELLP
ncbi:MAG: hypothetical protein Q8O35_06705 [Humidesulfovibrio sp.]|uniref:hypothetical protein n=1 Tax=Humidesulfovibrio sp. TaxID=2910988 RepID=UPI002737028B|nr:hypothetical protein [Humidesulfovibrio sp.]MDP2847868.1 hypothetical protein [Humidesulfovibrio sp.]